MKEVVNAKPRDESRGFDETLILETIASPYFTTSTISDWVNTMSMVSPAFN